MRFLRFLSGVTLRDRMKSKDLRNQWEVEEMTHDIKNYQLKWNQHILRVPQEWLPLKALHYKAQGRI